MPSSNYAGFAYSAVLAYTAYAFVTVIYAWRTDVLSRWWPLLTHVIDLGSALILVRFTDGSGSPFVAFLLFPLLPVAVWEGSNTGWSNASAQAWLGVVYMAAFSSVLAYLIYYHALTYIAASRVSAFSYLQPLVAVLLAIPLLHERVTAPLLIGGALVLTGVYVTERA